MKKLVFDAITGKETYEDILDSIGFNDLQRMMLDELHAKYNDKLLEGFISSASGNPILFGYDSNYQLIYSKWANVLALDTSRASVTFSTPDGTVVTLTRSQFIQFMNDAETFELNLFNNRMDLETKINSATIVDELNLITITL